MKFPKKNFLSRKNWICNAPLSVSALLASTVVLFGFGIASNNALSQELNGPKPPLAEIKKRLTPLQFRVTQEEGTERAFKNKYWDNNEPGIYVDILSGEPLYSSTHKYKSGTGWPSFWQAIEEGHLVKKVDKHLTRERIELRSKKWDNHLGHVFKDGPPPTGDRHCINSAALKFIPVAELEKKGYGRFLKLFPEAQASPNKDAKSSQKKSAAIEATAVFAGGCFWCMEPPFDKLKGVKSTISGYMGGHKKKPTYKEVSAGSTGHTEVVKVTYDPSQISYQKLVNVFFMNINPTTPNRQFVDVGSQYRPEIFYSTDSEKQIAESTIKKLDQKKIFGDKIRLKVTRASQFYKAEEYHQDYYKKNPIRYKFYRSRSGRDDYLERIWGKKK